MKDLKEKLAVARGEKPADLVLKNAKVVNVLSAEIHDCDVAVSGGRIVGLGEYDGREIIDLAGKYVAPSFIDGHIHVESSMLTLPQFARAVVPSGTGAVVIDPHEYANVVGLKAIDYILDTAERLPLDVFVMMSSCVPATPLETSGATVTAEDIGSYIPRNRVAGIAEMMNFPGVFLGWDSELRKLEQRNGKEVDGHSPGLSGKNLNAYILAGIGSDHECTGPEEAREKLRLGMHILVREGTAERNLHALLPLVTPENSRNFSFATDDKHPADLMDEGHIDYHVREAIKVGIPPVIAIQMATINTARHWRLRNLGAVAPRFRADLVVFSDLNAPRAEMVFKRGALVAENRQLVTEVEDGDIPDFFYRTMRVADVREQDLRVPAREGEMHVIELVPRQIVTNDILETPKVDNGEVVPDIERDVLKLVVVERHRATGNIGRGFVRGFGLKAGALGSTVAHDSHNIIVVGTNDADIKRAIGRLVEMGGGQCVIRDGEVLEELPLPVAGLVSDQPLPYVRKKVDDLIEASHRIGGALPDPFMTLSFLALSPIPALKVTDQGLVDAVRFQVIDLFEQRTK